MAAEIWEIQHFSEVLHLRSLVPNGSKMCKFVFLHFWQKSESLEWLQFWGQELFLKIAKSSLLRYPVG